ncbi:MAG: hypothetical protein WEC84_03705, partial [Candidatus Andersenbacteria bacterium]
MNIWRQRQRYFSALLVCKVLLTFGVGYFLGVKPYIVSAAVTTLSGTVYTDEGSTNIGADKTVRVAINGTDHGTTDETDASGVYSIADVEAEAGDVITVYLEDETEDAVTVTISDGEDLSSLDLYQDRLITRHDNGGSLTNANLDTGVVDSEDDISNMYSVDANGVVTTASGKDLLVWGGDTYAPGALLTVGGDLVVQSGATLSGTYNVTVGGGSTTGDGTINLTEGIFRLEGTGSFGGSTNWTFNNLTFGDGSTSATTSKAGSNDIEVMYQLKVSSAHTLNASSNTWNFTGSGAGAFSENLSSATSGNEHTCALKSDGSRVYCWGNAADGRLGNGATTGNQSSPVEVLGVGGSGTLSDISAISAGASHTCALKSDGSRVYCWGAAGSGRLGNGTTTPNQTSPVEVLGVGGAGNLSGISAVSAGASHTCALKSDGSRVYCWGGAGNGRLGNGTTTPSQSSPVEVLGVGGTGNLSDISGISAGTSHTCALKSDGSRVYCWGLGSSGQRGDGSTVSTQSSPVEVLGVGGSGTLSDISQVSAGGTHTCALKSDGSRVYCWGLGSSGQRGDGSTVSTQSSPVEVLGVGGSGTLSDISQVSAGGTHTCALKSDGSRVYCWGSDSSGQLGNGATTGNQTSPVEVLGVSGTGNLSDISAISAGDRHTCALKSDGSRVYCWGDAASGRLGNSQTSPNRTTPVEVLGVGGAGNLSGISAVSAGSTHTCALKSDGSRVYCWGNAADGRLGNGATTGNQTSPVEVLGVSGTGNLSDISAISAGDRHTCALKSDGSRVYCWGFNFTGQLGDGTSGTENNRSSPVEVLGVGGSGNLSGISAVSAGAHHTCALKSDGTRVYCWG